MEKSKYQGQKAISYQRASAGKGRGQDDSTDRQSDTAIVYCEDMGMELDLSYRILDEGVSAYRTVSYTDDSGKQRQGAKNLVEGALAQFVDNVKGGAFPNGINLIIEKLDRMYRDDPMDAMGHFLALLKEGVTIHTMIDKQVYSKNSDNKQVTMMMSIMYLVASHQYSKDLSERIKMSYRRRIDKMLNNEGYFQPTGRLKDWIEVKKDKNGNKTPFVTEDNKRLIRTIFEMYQDGVSVPKICQTFHAKGILDFNGNSWEHWKVSDVLFDRGVIGKYTPKDGYEIHFEEMRAVDDTLFHQVQKKRKSKYRKGRQSKEGHVFNGLVKCGYCCTTKKQTHLRGKAVPSTLRFNPAYKHNVNYIPIEVRPPYRGYKCTRGVEDKRDCYGGRIEYTDIESTFFAFVRELEFGKLLKPNQQIDTKIHEQKIYSYRAKIAELEKRIEDITKLISVVSNESQLEKYGQEVDELSADRDLQEQKITDEKMTMNRLKEDQEEVLTNEATIKDLIDTCSTDHEHFAFMAKLVDINAKKDGKGEYKDKVTKWTKKDQLLYDEMMELWDSRSRLNHADWEGDDALATEIEERQLELRKKYFAKPMQQDRFGYNLKLRLNFFLKKFIKEIKVYQFGFSQFPATAEFVNRMGKPTSLDRHNKVLNEFLLEHDRKQNEEIAKLKPKKPKQGWKQYELMNILGCKDRKTYRRWVARGMPNVLEGDTLEDAQSWVRTDRVMNPRNKINVQKGNITKRFFGMSIEFTEICKNETIKYVIPYWKDKTSGVCFDYKRGSLDMKFSGSFGKQNIKWSKTMSKNSKSKDKNTFYVSEDVFFYQAVQLALDSTIRKTAEFQEGKRPETKVQPKHSYTLENFKKLRSDRARNDFVMDMQDALGNTNKYWKVADGIIELSKQPKATKGLKKLAENLDVARDNVEKFQTKIQKLK
jgi:hypothetical protein